MLDHATDTAFKKLVLKVRNTTPAVADSVTGGTVPQPMSAGKFVAVVRYHRDLVQLDDLSKSIGVGDCDNLAAIYGAGNEPAVPGHDPTRSTLCRDGNETMVTSAPLAMSLDPDEQKEMSFDFSANPVSLKGVDYALQVIYRGPLGYEDDAVVSGYRELMDPMFVTRHNMYDYIASNTDSLYNTYFRKNLYQEHRNHPELPWPPTNGFQFYSTNSPVSDSYPQYSRIDNMASLNWQCWSIFAIETLPCYSHLAPMKHTHTLGTRAQPPVAYAANVNAGEFTRMALLVPLLTTVADDLPMLRTERQRMAGGPFMGESVKLDSRHRSATVQWPGRMRGVNAWHSSGYAWMLQVYGHLINSMEVGYCLVVPSATISANNVAPYPDSDSNGARFAPQTVTISPDGTVYVQRADYSGTVDCAQSGYSSNLSLAGTYDNLSRKAFAITGRGTIWGSAPYPSVRIPERDLFSTYSPWDFYIGTAMYSPKETPAPYPDTQGFSLGSEGDQYPGWLSAARYVAIDMLDMHGITGVKLSAAPPVRLTIPMKYR